MKRLRSKLPYCGVPVFHFEVDEVIYETLRVLGIACNLRRDLKVGSHAWAHGLEVGGGEHVDAVGKHAVAAHVLLVSR